VYNTVEKVTVWSEFKTKNTFLE